MYIWYIYFKSRIFANKCMYVCMYVCMYGWMDGWMDVWMYVCMYDSAVPADVMNELKCSVCGRLLLSKAGLVNHFKSHG